MHIFLALRTTVLVIAFFIMVCTVTFGQSYPYKPIRIVTGQPGGSDDLAARIVAQQLSGPLGRTMIVDNRESSILEPMIIKNAVPDGYTLLVAGGILWIKPLLEKTPYDPVLDFSPISLLTSTPNILVVHPSVNANSVNNLIALAKSKPGQLNYSSAPPGSSLHLAMELFKSMAQVNIVLIPYKGAGPAINALMAGEVQTMFAPAGAAMPHVRAGRMKALAVGSLEPSTLVPELPTIAASGLPGFESVQGTGMFAPARTPSGIINRVHQELVRGLNNEDVKEKFRSVGADIVSSSPADFALKIKSDLAKWGKLIKDVGIRSQ